MSTKETPGAFDALEKAEPGEVMFPLLSRDPCAPATVRFWAHQRRNRAFKMFGHIKTRKAKKLFDAELQQCAQAEKVAFDMEEQRGGDDEVEATKATYADVERTEAELAEASARKRRDALVRHLREAAYHLCEAKDGLIAEALIGDVTQNDMVQMLARINGLADEYSPKRPDFATEPVLPLPEGANG